MNYETEFELTPAMIAKINTDVYDGTDSEYDHEEARTEFELSRAYEEDHMQQYEHFLIDYYTAQHWKPETLATEGFLDAWLAFVQKRDAYVSRLVQSTIELNAHISQQVAELFGDNEEEEDEDEEEEDEEEEEEDDDNYYKDAQNVHNTAFSKSLHQSITCLLNYN
jgi:hypothetical protein